MVRTDTKRRAYQAHAFAFAFAFLVVLQSGLGAFASGAMPFGLQRDLFGNPLCLSGHGSHNTNSVDHDTRPACCTINCLGMSFAAAPLPNGAWALPQLIAASVLLPPRETIRVQQDKKLGYSPRGPPRSV